MPSIVLTAVLVLTVIVMRSTAGTAPAEALRVHVVGHRWWYEIRYPEYGVVTANELHLPVGRPIELTLSSADVIHSFWVPPLAGKLDMLPDRTNSLVLRADEAGEYLSLCAEFCGLQHAKMRMLTVVQPADEFMSWLVANGRAAVMPTSALSERGHAVFFEAGCSSCHAIRGTEAAGVAGPDLTHMSSRRTIASITVERTEQSLRTWIADPDQIKEGAQMPPSLLDKADMDALLAYLAELQ